MAKIKNITAYPTVTPSVSDLIIGTDVNDGNKTVTFLVGALGGGVAINQDLNSVLGVGNTSLLNIELNGNASALGSSITVIDIFPTTISAGGLGSHGTAGQVLSSTGTGIAWIAAPGTTQSWNDTLAISPVATANPVLTGIFTFNTGGGLDLNGTSYLNVRGLSRFYNTVTIDDGVPVDFSTTSKILINSLAGSAGQFLSATATGLAWSSGTTINNPTLQQVVTAGNTLLNSSIVFTGTGGISLSGTNTITGQGVINLNGNATPTTSATQGRIIMSQGSISLSGANTQILLGGNSGTIGQSLVSNGPFITPTWQTITGSSATLQQVLNNGNTATQNINLTGDITLVGGGLKLGANAYVELNGDRGTLGQVLQSGGPGGFPSWGAGGTGTVTSVAVNDTTYLDMAVDLSAPAIPSLTTSLITTGSVTTGPGGLTTAFYDDDTTGTNYAVGSGLTTTTLTGSGSGIVVNIINTTAGNVVLADLTFQSGGSGYVAGNTFQINQTGSDNNLVIEVDGIATGTFYDQSGRFSKPKGADWDITVTNVGSSMVITNSDGVNSSFFTLTGGGGATFSNQGSNIIELDFTGSGTGTVQSISLTDSTATIGTPITSTGSFTFSEQVASATYLRTTSAVSGTAITLSTESPTIQVVATKGGTLLNTALTIQNGNGTTNNSFVLGTTAVPSVASAGQVLAYNSTSGGYMEWVAQTGGGNMTSWDITGDTGGAGTVLDGQTVNIVGGTGVNTVSTPGTNTVTISATGATLALSGSANSVVGTNNALTVSISSAGTGYIANNYYPTTKLVSAIGTATGAIVRVFSVDATGGITGVSVYGSGKDWTVGDTLTVNFGTALATLTVASVGTTDTVTTTWRGLSGSPVDSFVNYKIRNLGRFEDNLTMYSSNINEVTSTGASNLFTGTFIEIGDNTVITPPINGLTLLDNTGGDLGLITRTGNTNIKIGAYGLGWDYNDALCLHNIGIGQDTNKSLTTGSHNIAMGDLCMKDLTTGTNNIAIGKEALRSIITESGTIAIGQLTGSDGTPQGDLLIGSGAGRYIENAGGSNSEGRIAIGTFTMGGTSANPHQANQSDVAIGDRAKQYKASSATGQLEGNGVYIGVFAGRGNDNFLSSGNSNNHVTIGSFAMGNGGASAREGQIAIGYASSMGDPNIETETYNTSKYGIAIGVESEGTAAVYRLITRSGTGNIAIGFQAAGTTGSTISGGTVAIGSRSLAEGSDSIAIGTDATAGDAGGSKDDGIAIGNGASSKFLGGVALGAGATTTDANQLAIGSSSNNVGTVIVAPPATTTTTWTVKINGTDYKIPMYAA